MKKVLLTLVAVAAFALTSCCNNKANAATTCDKAKTECAVKADCKKACEKVACEKKCDKPCDKPCDKAQACEAQKAACEHQHQHGECNHQHGAAN